MSSNPDSFWFAGSTVERESGWKVLLPKTTEDTEGMAHEQLGAALGDQLDEWEEIWSGDASWKRVVIAIPDATRRTPIRRVWDALLPQLTKRGFTASSVQWIVASGTHGAGADRVPIDPDGGELPARPTVHDCDREGRTLGTTRAGTPVEIASAFADADLRITIGPISFHYFAGFGGGPKMIFPGLASRDGAIENHRLALGEWQHGGIDVDCGPGRIAGNPVAEDIAEAASMCSAHVAVHTLEIGDEWRYFLAEDGLDGAREELLETGSVGKRGKFPIVVACGAAQTTGRDLVQANKGLRHAAAYLEPDGVLIYDAPLPGGFGSPEMTRWMDVEEPEDLVDRAHDEYDLNAQTAISLRSLLHRHRVLWSGTDKREMLEPFGVRTFSSWREALEEAARETATRGAKGKIAMIPDPTRIIPK